MKLSQISVFRNAKTAMQERNRLHFDTTSFLRSLSIEEICGDKSLLGIAKDINDTNTLNAIRLRKKAKRLEAKPKKISKADKTKKKISKADKVSKADKAEAKPKKKIPSPR